jgi:hypothetical protein
MTTLFRVMGIVCALAGWLIAARVAAESRRAEALHVDFSLGLGLGGRAIERPILEGVQRIGPGYFPTADVGVRAHAWPEQTWSLGVSLRYQTSLVDTAWEHAPLSPDSEVHVRCHHVELGMFPTWRPAAGSSWSLAVGAGYAMRVLWPDVHNLQTPRQVLTGPFLRPELWLTGLGPLSLRFGPELQAVLTMDHALRAAVSSARGLAVGGQLSALVELGEQYRLELMYRESRVLLVQDFSDTERFVTAVLTRKF